MACFTILFSYIHDFKMYRRHIAMFRTCLIEKEKGIKGIYEKLGEPWVPLEYRILLFSAGKMSFKHDWRLKIKYSTHYEISFYIVLLKGVEQKVSNLFRPKELHPCWWQRNIRGTLAFRKRREERERVQDQGRTIYECRSPMEHG